MFGSLGVPELLLIFVVILIVFGPRRIPEIGRTLGKALGEFRKATDDLKSTIEKEVRLEELKKITPPTLESFMADSVSRNEPFTPGVPPPPVTVQRDDATSNPDAPADDPIPTAEPVVEPMTPARSE
jgi:TatA/E family protein of Tat protein translocase